MKWYLSQICTKAIKINVQCKSKYLKYVVLIANLSVDSAQVLIFYVTFADTFYSESQSTLFRSPKLLFVHLFNDNSGKSRKWNIGSYVRYKNNLQPWTVILNRCSIWKLAPAVYILWDGQYSDSFYIADKCSVNISIMIMRFHEYLFKTINCIRMSQKVF